ncbi:MAG: hypothetical protein R2844_04790 [Caldilineales bacterium]
MKIHCEPALLLTLVIRDQSSRTGDVAQESRAIARSGFSEFVNLIGQAGRLDANQ